jgi:hypothetical protein
MQDVVNKNNNTEAFDATVGGVGRSITVSSTGNAKSLGSKMKSSGVANSSIVNYKGTLYYYTENEQRDKSGETVLVEAAPRAFKVVSNNVDKILKQTGWTQYKTGGIADFTGPAWLDGTKSRPEMVLNARDTENFIQLKDILSEILNGTDSINKSQNATNGDNYFDIDITVEDIGDDYDVEQLASKIRSMLYDDATYRNVNALSFSR